jgi:hypothetical protein
MNGASVVASLPLTSPLITPSTGEAEPRGSSCVLYDAYNAFTLRMNGPLGVCRKVQVVQSIFLPFMARRPHQREDPTMTLFSHDFTTEPVPGCY